MDRGILIMLYFYLCVARSEVPLTEVVKGLWSDPSYQKDIRPFANQGKPVMVKVGAQIDHIGIISSDTNELGLTLYLRQRWYDKRLAFEHLGYPNRSLSMHNSVYNSLWVPDLFVSNLKDGSFHTITEPNRLIRIYSDGQVLYSQRLSLQIICEMELIKYPMDEQNCVVQWESFGYTTDDVRAEWSSWDFTLRENISHPDFDILGYDLDECLGITKTGNYTCLTVTFHFKRRLMIYILSVYIPSFLVVTLSGMSFWIDMDSVPARISLAVITILTITSQTFDNNRGLFTTSVVKAMDIWMAVCLFYVFGSFVEYAVVNTLQRRANSKRKPYRSHHCTCLQNGNRNVKQYTIHGTQSADSETINGYIKEDTSTTYNLGQRSYWSKLRQNKALLVDVCSRMCFPITFLAFNVVYWTVYLNI